MWYGGQCVFNNSACPQSISSRPYSSGDVLKIIFGLLVPAMSLNQLTPSQEKIAQGKEAAGRLFFVIDRVPKIRSKKITYLKP